MKKKAEAALENIKIHQLVFTQELTGGAAKIHPSDATDENTLEDLTTCLISAPDAALNNEKWLPRATEPKKPQPQ